MFSFVDVLAVPKLSGGRSATNEKRQILSVLCVSAVNPRPNFEGQFKFALLGVGVDFA